MIYLVGGPPHQDMWDLKPDAPAEIAGPMRPIATNVPGIEICELFPQLAQRMDKLVPIRSIVDAQSRARRLSMLHRPQARQGCARRWLAAVRLGGGEAARAAASRRCRRSSACATPRTHGPYNEPGPGFLGIGQSPLSVARRRARTTWCCKASRPTGSATGGRCSPSMDRLRRDVDASGNGWTASTPSRQQALDILTSSQLADALDLSKEDPKTVARYGTGDDDDP